MKKIKNQFENRTEKQKKYTESIPETRLKI